MKLVVISDLHDNLINLKQCLDWCKINAIEAMLCAGDLTNKDTLDHLAKDFSEQIYLARGNACNYDEALIKNYPNISYLGRDGMVVELEGSKIGVCHEPFLIDKLLIPGPKIIFYGHTHKPRSSYAPYSAATLEKQKASEDKDETREGARLVNPGALGGMFQKATFAAYDTASDKLELKILETL